jgi:hypothetical protein
MTVVQNLNVNQGDSFSQTLTVAGITTLLTGYTVTARIRKWYGSTSLINMSSVIASNTTITVSLTAAETALLPAGRLIYEVQVASAGQETRTHEGQLIINPGLK